MRATDLAAVAGLSYRQVDHWVSSGYITCYCGQPHGHGYPRHFTRREAAVTRIAAELANAGLAPGTAVLLARRLAATGSTRITPGLALTTDLTGTRDDAPIPHPRGPARPKQHRTRRRSRDADPNPQWVKDNVGVWRAS